MVDTKYARNMRHDLPAINPVSNLKAYILNRFACGNPNYTSWMSGCPYQCEIIDEFVPTWTIPDDAGIVITHMHYRWEEISALRRIYESTRVPILILSDGILEYRNTWENPSAADGSVFQPLFGHKLACISRAQARIAESWGNVGKCEIVGLPKFDSLQDAEHLPVCKDGPFRLMVATANTPAFDDQQRAKVIHSLRVIRKRLELNPWVNHRPLEITWRLTDGLDQELGIQPGGDDPSSAKAIPLSDAIELADAVITTPSTLYLESVMKRRPTAILDFTNSPMYVGAAWTITAPAHLNEVLGELESPPPAKMLFQRSVLHDNLELDGSAKSRLFTLIKTMIEAGVVAQQNETAIELPTRVLSDPQRGIQRVEGEFDLASLHPDNPNFQITEVERLQQELNQAIARLGQLPKDLDTKHAGNQILAQQLDSAERRIKEGLEREKLHLELVEQKSAVIAQKSRHIDSLQMLFQEANARVKQFHSQLVEMTNVIKSHSKSRSQNRSPQPDPATADSAKQPLRVHTAEVDANKAA